MSVVPHSSSGPFWVRKQGTAFLHTSQCDRTYAVLTWSKLKLNKKSLRLVTLSHKLEKRLDTASNLSDTSDLSDILWHSCRVWRQLILLFHFSCGKTLMQLFEDPALFLCSDFTNWQLLCWLTSVSAVQLQEVSPDGIVRLC